MDKKEITGSENKLDLIKGEIDEFIFDEEEWIDKKMWKIAEVTYSYYSEKDFNLNTTLFCNIGEADLYEIQTTSLEERKEIILKAYDILRKKIKTKQELIQKYITNISQLVHQSKEEKYEIEIILNALIEKQKLLKHCLLGIPYELEKAGIQTQYNSTEIDKQQAQIEKEVFGGKIKNNPEEVKLCCNDIITFFNENKNNLSEEEQLRFEAYINKALDYTGGSYTYSKPKKLESAFEPYKNFKVKDSRYIPGFNLFIEALNGLRHVVSQNTEVGSISDGPKGVEFPKNKKFEKILLGRFLKLNAHEIETHSITDHNHKKIIGNTRGEKSIEKDEGLASFMELMLEYGTQLFIKDKKTGKMIIDVSKIGVTYTFANILFGEILTNDELLDFLRLKEKLAPQRTTPDTIFLRIKRLNKDGVQHKDCTYTRGLLRLVQEVNRYILSDGKEGIKFEDLFLGKVGFDEVRKLVYIRKKRDEKHSEIKSDALDIKKPLFASDAILYFLEKRKNNQKINEIDFLKYLKNKYPILDFTEDEIRIVNKKTRESLAIIFNLLNPNVSTQNKTSFIVVLEQAIKNLGKERAEEVIKFQGIES